MTIGQAIEENLEAIRAANPNADDDVSNLERFKDLEFTSRRSVKGRKGRVFTIFETAKGPVGFWPHSSHVDWYRGMVT